MAVLGARAAGTLYPGVDPVGQQVRLAFAGGRFTLPFVVVGVLEEQGGASEANDQAFIPLRSIANRLRFLHHAHGGPARHPDRCAGGGRRRRGFGERRRSRSCCCSATRRPSRTL